MSENAASPSSQSSSRLVQSLHELSSFHLDLEPWSRQSSSFRDQESFVDKEFQCMHGDMDRSVYDEGESSSSSSSSSSGRFNITAWLATPCYAGRETEREREGGREREGERER